MTTPDGARPRSCMPPPDEWGEGSQRLALYEWVAGSDLDWSWFLTLTFRYDASLEATRRAWRRFLRELAHLQPRWTSRERRKRLPSRVRAFERHSQRDGYHVHALVADVGEIDPNLALEWWENRYGIAQIRRFDPLRGGLAYVLKHADDPEADVTFAFE